jgi:hypothetical protein
MIDNITFRRCKKCEQDTSHIYGICHFCEPYEGRKQSRFTQASKEIIDNTIKSFEGFTVSSTGSVRHNAGKPEMSQLDPRFVMAMADLLTQSDKTGKYDKYNWKKGQKYSVICDSLDRHIHEFKIGEDIDPESQKSHLIHAAINLMFLWNNYMQDNPEFDDREFKEKKDE